MILPELADPPAHYRLPLPLERVECWLTLNQRHFWARRSRLVKQWRQLGWSAAVQHKVPLLAGAYVIAELRFADRRRRDPHNWQPTAKAALDGLVDAGVFADDNSHIIVGPDMRVSPVVTPRGQQALILHLWPQDHDRR